MNEQLTQFDFSGDGAKSTINPALISMQIKAIQKSLQRLVNQDDVVLAELPGSELNEAEGRPQC
jgi:hypothetical protein